MARRTVVAGEIADQLDDIVREIVCAEIAVASERSSRSRIGAWRSPEAVELPAGDHALLLLAVQTGLRVSELTGLTGQDAHLGAGPHVRCHGKGRKDRATPLTSKTVKVLRNWLAECDPSPDGPLFPTRAGGRLSRDAVERLVAKHAAAAAAGCPSSKEKNVTPHTLRHTAAMSLLRGGVDTSVIALWLGHEDAETTQIYLHADMTIKEQALARVQQPGTSPGRYRPPDTLLAFLDNL